MIRRLLAAVILFHIASAAPAYAEDQPLPTALEIRTRSAAAEGPVPKNLRKTIVVTSPVVSQVYTTYQSGDDIRNVLDVGGMHSEDGFYHHQGWDQDANGITVLTSARYRPARTHVYDGGTVSRVYDPVDAYLITDSGLRSYYDPESYLLVRIENPYSGQTSVFSDFATFGSQKLARTTRITSRSGTETRIEIKDYAEGAVADDDVRVPDDPRTLVEFPANARGVDLPVRFLHNIIFVRATISGQVVDLKLDTGSSSISVDKAMAARAGWKLQPEPGFTELGPGVPVVAIVPEIRIGDLVMHDVVVRVSDNALAENPTGAASRGELGFDFLARLGVTIDYQAHTVHAVPVQEYEAPSGPDTSTVPLQVEHRVPAIKVRIGDRTAYNVILTTAYGGQLSFFSRFAKANSELFDKPIGTVIEETPAGKFESPKYQFPAVDIGPMEFRNFIVVQPPSTATNTDSDGAIGYDLLSLFNIGLDFARSKAYFTLNAFGKKAASTP